MNRTQTLDGGGYNRLPFTVAVNELTTLTDEELLKRSLQMPSAFETLMARHQREFIARAQAVVKSRDDAEDIVQETFVRIYRFAPKFSEENGTFRAWSVTILMNVARTRYQKVAKERGVFAKLEDEHFVSLAEVGRSQHDAYLDTEEVKRVLARVDADTAEILTLAYLEGLPYEQIAELKETSVGAIKARVHRAKLLVRNALDSGEVQ
jgi:RNA polymerase sigma-70 factor (ECF subfamily)